MSQPPCPYKSLPATSYWRRSISTVSPDEIDPVLNPKFTIRANEKVSTAGSCFAQNIARYLARSGFGYFVTEPGHAILHEQTRKTFNYGTFSARYGNIYTTRQLLQTFERAYGQRVPVDDIWIDPETGTCHDPFRPFIQPEGFANRAAFDADRKAHFHAIRRIVEDSDVFVFTLGLTEAWENAGDGTVYAICPGCGAGTHDPERHKFRNFNVAEAAADLLAAITFLRARNPAIRILLTVSPVPLIATFERQHVLTATTYSKSVLRVVAQMASDAHDFVDYFPSYEIITAGFSRGSYFGEDLRDVEEIGVAHAMRSFFGNYLTPPPDLPAPARQPPVPGARAAGPAAAKSASQEFNDLICDEERLEDI